MTNFFKILLTIFFLTSCSEEGANTYFESGKQKLKQGDYSGAKKAFNKAAKIDPNNKLNFYFQELSEKQVLMDYKNSIKDLDQIIQINPNEELAYEMRAKIRYILGDNDRAIDDLNKLITINSNYDEVYITRGWVRFILGDDRAIDDFNKSVELNPSLFSSYAGRARFKFIIGDKDGAVADYNKALEIKGDSKDVETYVARAEMKLALGDKDGTVNDYSKALEIKDASKDTKNYAMIYAARGNVKGSILNAQKSGDYKNAIMDFDKAVMLNPKKMFFLEKRGILKYISGDNLGAVEDLEKIIEAKDVDISRVNLASVYYHKALAEMNLKNYENALGSLRKVLEIEPKNSDAISKLNLIQGGKNNKNTNKCSAQLIKMIDHGYSKSFYFYLSDKDYCNIDSNPNEKNKTLLISILNQIKKKNFYKENCPKCSIDVYTDMQALEYDYKVMNWDYLGIDQCSYNKLRYDGRMQVLLKKHLVLSFDDFQYGNEEKILTYPCQKNGQCEDSTNIPKSIRAECNF